MAVTEQIDALLLAADLYDSDQTSMKTARFLAEQIRRLHEAGIRVFVIRGNHDALSRSKEDLLASVPGVGKTIARTLIAGLRAATSLSRKLLSCGLVARSDHGADEQGAAHALATAADEALAAPLPAWWSDTNALSFDRIQRGILAKYAIYCNEVRTYVSLGKDAPCTRPIERFRDVVAHPILGGRHHRYARI
jgi:hypothetical protein